MTAAALTMSSGGVQALGGFYARIIELRNLDMGTVLDKVGVQRNYLWRLEHGDIAKPSVTNIAKLNEVLDINPSQVQSMLTDPDATGPKGRRLAEMYESLPPWKREAVETAVFKLRQDNPDVAELLERINHQPEMASRLVSMMRLLTGQ